MPVATMVFESSDVARLVESQAVVAIEVLKLASNTVELVSEETQTLAAGVVRKFLATKFVKLTANAEECDEGE